MPSLKSPGPLCHRFISGKSSKEVRLPNPDLLNYHKIVGSIVSI
jgi:hypothetical protein